MFLSFGRFNRSVGLVFETCVVIGHLKTCRSQKGFQVSGLHKNW